MNKMKAGISIPLFLIAFFLNLFPQTGDWSPWPRRDRWMQPDKTMDAIGVKEGMVIGEVGAGTGYFTFKLSKRVGDKGAIYANDIDRSALGEVEDRCQEEGITNIEIVVGEIDDPLFPQKELDMVIMVYVFHDLEQPIELVNNIPPYLRAQGTLVIIDQDPERYSVGASHFLTKKEILDKMEQTPFALDRIETFLPRSTIFVFKLKEEEPSDDS